MPESWKLLSRRDSSREIMRVLGLSDTREFDDRSVNVFRIPAILSYSVCGVLLAAHSVSVLKVSFLGLFGMLFFFV
jgi:hypothetical protein